MAHTVFCTAGAFTLSGEYPKLPFAIPVVVIGGVVGVGITGGVVLPAQVTWGVVKFFFTILGSLIQSPAHTLSVTGFITPGLMEEFGGAIFAEGFVFHILLINSLRNLALRWANVSVTGFGTHRASGVRNFFQVSIAHPIAFLIGFNLSKAHAKGFVIAILI